jgi:hypothetical protein
LIVSKWVKNHLAFQNKLYLETNKQRDHLLAIFQIHDDLSSCIKNDIINEMSFFCFCKKSYVNIFRINKNGGMKNERDAQEYSTIQIKLGVNNFFGPLIFENMYFFNSFNKIKRLILEYVFSARKTGKKYNYILRIFFLTAYILIKGGTQGYKGEKGPHTPKDTVYIKHMN